MQTSRVLPRSHRLALEQCVGGRHLPPNQRATTGKGDGTELSSAKARLPSLRKEMNDGAFPFCLGRRVPNLSSPLHSSNGLDRLKQTRNSRELINGVLSLQTGTGQAPEMTCPCFQPGQQLGGGRGKEVER